MSENISVGSSFQEFDNDENFSPDDNTTLLTENPDGTPSTKRESETYIDTLTLMQMDYVHRQNERFKTVGAMEMMDGLTTIKSSIGLSEVIAAAKSGDTSSIGTGYQGDISGVTVPAGSIVVPVKGLTSKIPKADTGIGFDITKYSRREGTRKHEGVDLFAEIGTPVLSPWDGVVTSVSLTDNYPAENDLGGKTVTVKSSDGIYSGYHAHLDKVLVSRGQTVSAGDIIGTVGITGNARPGGAANAHLHFGVTKNGTWINPEPILSRAERV